MRTKIFLLPAEFQCKREEQDLLNVVRNNSNNNKNGALISKKKKTLWLGWFARGKHDLEDGACLPKRAISESVDHM